MAFVEVTKMDQRRALAYRVLVENSSLSRAAREFGVSRPTARLWVERAREVGLAALAERSRRPQRSPHALGHTAVEELLAEKARFPEWGAKKLLARLWPSGTAPLSLRTANRVLSRQGLSCARAEPSPGLSRFEREDPNELWQMDFKGLKYPKLPYEALSVIDDASRFCLALAAVPDQTTESVWSALWEAFGQYGLPDCILCNNGPAFRAGAGRLPGTLAVRLLKLGVAMAHGRPFHPQTQGKVERFHGTLARELGAALRQPARELAAPVYQAFRDRYNWERPHEAIGLRVPGCIYRPSARLRPERLPKHELPPGAISRSVDSWGNCGFRSRRYKVGRGFAGERVELREQHDGAFQVFFFGHLIGPLADFEV
jgi:transposase InsO family protein